MIWVLLQAQHATVWLIGLLTGTSTTLDSTRIISNITWPISSLPGASGSSYGPAPQSTPMIDYEAGIAVQPMQQS